MTKSKTKPTQTKITLNVEAIRVERGLTKKKMAESIGVSETAYGALSRNPTQIRLTTIQGLINMGIPLESIFIIQ